MAPDRSVSGSTPPNQVHVSGRGLRVAPSPDLPLEVRHVDGDLVDLTPQDPLALKRGSFELRLRQADVALPADRLATFLQSRLKADSVRNLNVRFKSPDQAIVTADVSIGGKLTPVRLDARLLAAHGRLALKPLSLTSEVQGFPLRWKPQAERVELDATDTRLMEFLLPKLNNKALSEVSWKIAPGNRLHAQSKLLMAGHTGDVQVEASLAPTREGKLAILAERAVLTWRGLRMEAFPQRQTGQLTGDQAAIGRLIAEELDIDRLRGVQVQFKPGNRFVLTGEIREGVSYRPAVIEGRLDVANGGLQVVPEAATVTNAMGGLDVTFEPQTGQTTASITDAALNRLLGPLAAKKGFADFNLRLVDGDRFVLDGVKVDAKDPSKRKKVHLEGQLALEPGGAVRFDFKKVKYGGISVNFDHLHVKLLGELGLHIDDFLKLDTPFAQVKKDALYFYPGKITPRVQGELEHLKVTAGKLSVRADVTTDLRTLLPFKHDKFDFDGKSFTIQPRDIAARTAGAVTGVRTGEGTITLDTRITPEDLQHMVRLKSGKVEFLGDRALLDPNVLQSKARGQVVGVRTEDGKATVELAVDETEADRLVPELPRGILFDGRTIEVPTEAIDRALRGQVTGVCVENGEVRVQIGAKAAPGEGNRAEATLRGAMTVSGIVIEDAEASLVDHTPNTPLDPRQLKEGQLKVTRGRAFIPRERVEALLATHLDGKKLKGFKAQYAPEGLKVEGRWKGIPIRGHIAVSGGGAKGLALAPRAVRFGPLPVPEWLATRLVGWLAGMPVESGKLHLDLARQAGVELGPLGEVQAAEDGLRVRIGA